MEKLHSNKKKTQFDLKVFVSGGVWYMINVLFNDGLSPKPHFGEMIHPSSSPWASRASLDEGTRDIVA